MQNKAEVTEWKGLMVTELEELVKKESNFYIANYLGLKADEINELRRLLEPFSSKYFVLKNSLAKIAFKNIGLDDLTSFIKGGAGMVFGGNDPIQTAKTITKFSKNHKALKVTAGLFEGKIIDENKIKYLASLPSREELIAKIVYGIKSPIIGFVGVLSNTLKGLVYALQAIKDKKEG